jgi:hypothetical protein
MSALLRDVSTYGRYNPFIASTNKAFANGHPTVIFKCPSLAFDNAAQYIGFALSFTTDVLSSSAQNKVLTLVMCLPLSKIFRLRITTSQKLGLFALFTLGLIYTTVEIVRLVLWSKADPNDSLAPARATMIINPIQSAIAVTVGCLPILRPLFFRKKFVGSSGGTPSNSNSGGRPWRIRRGQSIRLSNEEPSGHSASATASKDAPTEEHEMTILSEVNVPEAVTDNNSAHQTHSDESAESEWRL